MSEQRALAPAESAPLAYGNEQGASMFERLARDPSVDVDKLERLMQMHERLQAKSAEESFNRAMSLAQAEISRIKADAYNSQTRSRYVTYAALDRVLRPIYTKHGFALSFDTSPDAPDLMVLVLCYVTHTDGHARTYRADIPADGKGAKGGDVMTRTHAVGAGMAYGMRYLLKMIWNIAVGDEDDDGNSATAKVETAKVPDGYDKFIDSLEDVADEGRARLAEVFKSAKEEYRLYANRHDKDRMARIRAKAEARAKGAA